MKYLNLSSLFVLIVLFSSCHSTEVSLRGSKVQELDEQAQDIETDGFTFTNSKQKVVGPIESKITPINEVIILKNQPIETIANNGYTNVSQKLRNHHSFNIPFKKTDIKHQDIHPNTRTTANSTSVRHSNGMFGSVGHSFGVVGIVFIFVGLILFLIGGMLIDTLGALFLGFGLVFLLIWLVLAVLQGLFDVIL